MRKYLKFFPADLSLSVTTLADELKVVPEKDILEQKLINAFSSVNHVRFTEEDQFCDTLESLALGFT